MNIIIDDTDYVGNHVYNYLREYLFDHPGDFYVYRFNYDTQEQPNLICERNVIRFQSKILNFPDPYGQHYCFYDHPPNPSETIFILDLCEQVRRMIQNQPFELKFESFSELPDRDRLKGKPIYCVRGGFGDNLCYIILPFRNENIFLACNRRYLGKKTAYNMECGQTNEELLKFPFKNLLTSPKLKAGRHKIEYLRSKTFSLFNEITPKLLNSISEYKQENLLKYLLNESNGYALIGIRFRYANSSFQMISGRCCANSFSQLKTLIDSITEFIKSNSDKDLVVMLDDWRFLKFFILMFYDLFSSRSVENLPVKSERNQKDLKNETIPVQSERKSKEKTKKRKIIVLNNVGVRDIHVLLKIGFHSKVFCHTYSGFYITIDRMKNIIGSDDVENITFR